MLRDICLDLKSARKFHAAFVRLHDIPVSRPACAGGMAFITENAWAGRFFTLCLVFDDLFNKLNNGVVSLFWLIIEHQNSCVWDLGELKLGRFGI